MKYKIQAAEDEGYFISKLVYEKQGWQARGILCAGTLNVCLAYLRKKFLEAEADE